MSDKTFTRYLIGIYCCCAITLVCNVALLVIKIT